ncbi:PSD1 and planctomycete cytochrome C domain-containing protein [Planctomicrobium sp. SH661]|uniref:PSD1 and planctomycete cytochrome C domain-containing protein n=1 Tax=Planctomicrobium sp. SH661 TaxID=3448124 RepID=UPI003F5BAB39
MMKPRGLFWGCLLLLIGTEASLLHAENSRRIDFSRQIRPILADKCLACHGTDANHREAGLRLDQSEDALRGGDSGTPAIVAGHPDKSELIRRIDSSDDSEQMPPPALKKSLTAEEKDLLRQWIAEGGEYQKHWAFQAPVRPSLPHVQQADWPRNEIDSFVLAQLEEAGLKPSPQADRITWIRRVTMDLTGLPPTLEELDAFLADQDQEAEQRVVDRLLGSPHYGERWGRMWLDGARYADSDGYEKDKPRFVWAYRDWVVQSFNRDLPYNEFIIEQLAGDLLPNPTQDQLVATGFLRNSMLNEEGGIDPEQFRMEAMFDRMDAIGKSILGLTLQCSQCHDHKYDPISQQDYYRLFAFFNDTHDASVPAYTPQQQMQRAQAFSRIEMLEEELKHRVPDWPQRLADWERTLPEVKTEWSPVAPRQEVSGAQKHYVLKNDSILAQGYAPTKSTTTFEVTSPIESVQSVRLELLNHPDLPLSGPGRAVDGTCALTEMEIEIAPADGSSGYEKIKISSAVADVNPPEAELSPQFADRSKLHRVTGPIEFAIDGKKETAWSINVGPEDSNVPRTAIFALNEPRTFPGGTKLRIHLVQEHGGWNSDDNQTNNLGCFRFSVTGEEQAKLDVVPVSIRSVLKTPVEARTSAQQNQLFSYWRTTLSEFDEVNRQIEEIRSQLPSPVTQPSLASREDLRTSFVLAKGNFLQPTEPVTLGVPAILHPLEKESPTRLDLARWFVDPRSPTVARSMVNRVWQTYFGNGLVSTSEDFGLQGEYPSHPELLDWLAVDFMEHGWSLKRLHRQILNSATYQQSSAVTPELLTRDPDNRLLARGSRFRMEAEGVRDLSLAVSGLINLNVGGPPVCPPCPEFLFQPPASYGPKSWPLATGPERYRRALYTFRFRSVPYPVLQIFDAPIGEVSCVRRTKSNTPLQALASLNEPVFLECARNLAAVSLQPAEGSDEERLKQTFRRCTSRLPTPSEQATLIAYLNRQRERLSKGEIDAAAIAFSTEQENPLDAAALQERAAWTLLSRVLLNLDETMTRQ